MRGCVAAGMVAAINYLGSILHLLSNEVTHSLRS